MSGAKFIVTIDGPSGAGKSTISRNLAARLGYRYLDTGAMYRAVGLKVQEEGVSLEDDASLDKLLAAVEIELIADGGETRVLLDGKDVSGRIRTAEMGMVASQVSANPGVRAKLTELQRQIGGQGSVVAEGRDMGTVVFPEAENKFFLDASPEERARRRIEQLREKGHAVDEDEILRQIRKRDRDDSTRTHAPLAAADDAIIVDSSYMSIEEVVSFMMNSITGRS